MKIAVLGTGSVGRILAGRFAQLGHDVTVGTRDVAATLARTGPDGFGTWHAAHPQVAVVSQADAAAGADLVVNATSGTGSLAALAAAGEGELAGRVLLDVSNPLDFSQGFPPTLSVKDTDSLAEQIQRAFPQAKVVKSLNTVNSALMADPAGLGGGEHSMFVSGDDADAKELVTGLLGELGWTDVIDLGPLSAARGQEMFLATWVRLMSALGTSDFNVKIVR